ncbi:MAG: hypothetical protein R6V83_03395 [Candidatus Thorarchaeota archaeon]
MDLLSSDEKAGFGDHDHAVTRAAEQLAVTGVMTRSTTGAGSLDRGRNPIPVNADKAAANSNAEKYFEGINASREGVEHKNFLG